MAIKQVPTSPASLHKIMRDSAFALGVQDYRAGLPLRDLHRKCNLSSYDIDQQWNYERGRAWAVVAPRTMPVRINGKLNPAAVKIARRAVL
jgi:hypothetical protein